jgi:hypothetical protein
MAVAPRSLHLGRHVFGAASLVFGLITLAWHNYNDREQLRYILNATNGPVFVYSVAAAQIFGGGAIQFPSDREYGSSRPGGGLSRLRLTMRPANRRHTPDLQSLGQFF